MNKKNVTLKVLLLLIVSDILETTVHFLFKKSTLSAGPMQVTDLASALAFFKVVILSPFLWFGLFTVVTVFILWSLILSKIDLSVAVPIASFSYILVPLISIMGLHEKISAARWMGVFLILAGVILVSLSSKEKSGLAK